MRLSCVLHAFGKVAVSAGGLLAASIALGQTTAPATPAIQTATPTTPTDSASSQAAASANGPLAVSGFVLDPDGAAIPGATVTLTPASGKPYTTVSGADGSYALRAVPPGTYAFTVTVSGFATFARLNLKIAGATPLAINPKLAIQNTEQVVNVTTTQNAVSTDADSNASATVLKGKDLDALSDDPDELSTELSELAGPAAGPNGGQIYIDGFTGGQLPPKSSIREIRINQNPFSAQYDRVGFGRVEVFTKPGTDKLHGSAQLNGLDRSFNTGSPYIPPSLPQPDYHTIFSFASVTGPINKNASFTMNGSYRNIQDNIVINPPALYATDASSGNLCYPGTPGCQLLQTSSGNGFTYINFNPQLRWDVSPRIDLALGSKNTLTARFQYEHDSRQNEGVGNDTLLSNAYNSLGTETTLQLSDTQILSSRIINETRFEFQRTTADTTPRDFSPTINVQGAFLGGGLNAGASSNAQNHIELQNYTSIALVKHFLRLGGRLRTTSETNTTNAGANGSFTYNSIASYLAGTPSQYSITRIAVPTIGARNTDLGVYAEDDWKIRPNLTLSYGLRFETQNFIHDHADFAPRLSAAYGISKKTVLRAGVGLFYDRFLLADQFNVLRNNGTNQQQFILTATSAIPIPASCTPQTPSGCPTSAGRLTTRTLADRMHSPYSIQANLGVDQQLTKTATVSVNYQHIRGVHQYNSLVANYGTALPTDPIQYQYQSEGIFNQNQLIANVNFRGFHNVTLFGFYVLNFAKADTGGVDTFGSQPFNLSADYGRATYDIRSRAFMGGNIALPHGISLAPLLAARAGTPFNVTAGTDVNGDTIYNDRPVYAAAGSLTAANGVVKTLGGCGTFATPGTGGNTTPVPINACTGPANFLVNLRASKTFGFGRKAAANADAAGQGGPGGPPGNGGPPPRGGGGGSHRGGPGGGFGGGSANSSKRYNLTLGAQAQNLFNVADRSAPVSTLTSPSFGTFTQLSGGFFTTDSAVRRVSLQLSFSF